MPDLTPQEVDDFFKMNVATATEWFEQEAPMYNAVQKYSDKKKLTPKGFRFSFWKTRPGGHTFPTLTQPDFNAAKPPTPGSFFIRATEYALPMIIHGRALEQVKSGGPDNLTSMSELMQLYYETATKRLEQMVPGDGTGALAYSNSGGSLGVGAQTLVCHTVAAATDGYTKGAFRLEQNQYYQSWHPTTYALHGTFHVITPGVAQCDVVVDSGTIEDEDILTDVGAVMKVPRGFAHLIGDQSRTLQTIPTGTNPAWNSPMFDLQRTITPSDIHTGKATVKVRNNKPDAENGLICFAPPGQMAILEKQGYGMRRYTAAEGTRGINSGYEDGDTIWVKGADMAEDRLYFGRNGVLVNAEEMPFGEYSQDGLNWRMLLGQNNTGSNRWQKSWGAIHNLGITNVRGCFGFKRCTVGVSQRSAGF